MPQTNPPPSILTLEVLQQFRIIYGSMRQYFREVEERCGISGAQAWALQEVERSPGIRIGTLAERMGIHQSTCSLLVDKLTHDDLLEKRRGQSDRRSIGLYITERGRTALRTLPGPAEGLLPDALSRLPEVALKTLQINLSELTRQLPGRSDAFAGMPLADLLNNDDGRHERPAR
ncbi:MAG: winged helix-turn-helix transcriptional regulator [Rhodocyclales bacterium]|nr:winged helix-turn-helix transcriptional regulator [Rhodocyclales bacterium]